MKSSKFKWWNWVFEGNFLIHFLTTYVQGMSVQVLCSLHFHFHFDFFTRQFFTLFLSTLFLKPPLQTSADASLPFFVLICIFLVLLNFILMYSVYILYKRVLKPNQVNPIEIYWWWFLSHFLICLYFVFDLTFFSLPLFHNWIYHFLSCLIMLPSALKFWGSNIQYRMKKTEGKNKIFQVFFNWGIKSVFF